MSKKGFVLIHRDIQKSWIWDSNEPFDKRSAFTDLILMMNHEERKIQFNGEIITVERGSKVTSLRDLAQRWGWSTKKVSGFLSRLEEGGTAIIERNTRFTLIKLVNYDIYQPSTKSKETVKKQAGNSEVTLRKTNNKLNELNTLNKTLSKDSVCDKGAHPRGKFGNVFLTDAEYEEYRQQYQDIDTIIEELSASIETQPGKYGKGHPTAWIDKFIAQKRKTNPEPKGEKKLTWHT